MDNIITFVDTETTGLLVPKGSNLENYPHIIEIYSVQIDIKKKKILNELNTLVKPPISIPFFITKINGIDDNMVKNAPNFKDIFKKVSKTVSGSKILVAQNLRFDHDLIKVEFKRLEKKIKMPDYLFCTVEQSMHLTGIRLKSNELYKLATGKESIKGHHRAKTDVDAMIEYFNFINSGYIPPHFKVKNEYRNKKNKN